MKLKIYIDGASRGNPGISSSACIIKDEKQNIICKQGKFLGKTTNNYAEFYALKLGLKKAKKLKASSLEIYSDSQLLVNQYNGIYKIKNPTLFDLMAEIRQLANNFKSLTLTHISRTLNAEADQLANVTLNRESCKSKIKNTLF